MPKAYKYKNKKCYSLAVCRFNYYILYSIYIISCHTLPADCVILCHIVTLRFLCLVTLSQMATIGEMLNFVVVNDVTMAIFSAYFTWILRFTSQIFIVVGKYSIIYIYIVKKNGTIISLQYSRARDIFYTTVSC